MRITNKKLVSRPLPNDLWGRLGPSTERNPGDDSTELKISVSLRTRLILAGVPRHRLPSLNYEAAAERLRKNIESNRERKARESKRIAALARVREKHSWIVGLPIDQAVSAQRAMLTFEWMMAFLALCVPKRLFDEEVGDACERLAKHFEHSSARWPAYLKLVTTMFWIVINTIGYAVARLKGSKRASGE